MFHAENYMFQYPHLIVMISTCILIVTVCKRLKNSKKETIDKFVRYFAVIALLFDPVYWIWEIATFGTLNLAITLPLYMCSLFWMLLPISAFSKNKDLRQVATSCICTFCMVGGVLGLVFNIYLDRYPFFSFVPIRSILYHIMMLLVGSVMWTSGYYEPKNKDKYLCAIPFVILFIPCLILNHFFGWDYLYTAGGIGTPLEIMSSVMPKPAFLIILYSTLYMFIRITFYAKFNPFLDKSNSMYRIGYND